MLLIRFLIYNILLYTTLRFWEVKTLKMTKLIMKSAIIIAIAIFVLESCKSPAGKVEDATEDAVEAEKALEKANQEYLNDIEKYRLETIAKIEENEQTILDFKEKIELEKKDVKAEYFKKIEELNKKNSDLKIKIQDYNVEGKEKWEAFKAEYNRDMEELGKAFKDLTIKNK